jgi:SAM-dependent methyltransferase
MTDDQALELARMTAAFYDACAPSFSATRKAPWAGWAPLFDALSAEKPARLSVLDVAAGNLRFERALADALPATALEATCVDSCPALLAPGRVPAGTRLERLDIVSALARDRAAAAFGRDRFDLAVCFGFLHHVPQALWRERLVDALLASVRPGGRVSLSFWMFLRSERLVAKAREATARASVDFLDEGDWLMGWQDREDISRYCHAFTEAEIDALLGEAGVSCEVVAVWDADGREGNLNRYVMLKRL